MIEQLQTTMHLPDTSQALRTLQPEHASWPVETANTFVSMRFRSKFY